MTMTKTENTLIFAQYAQFPYPGLPPEECMTQPLVHDQVMENAYQIDDHDS